MVEVGIVGATGYAGEELLRLLSAHPQVHICKAVSKSFAGQSLSQVYKNYTAGQDIPLEDLNAGELGSSCDYVFTALPHEESLRMAPLLMQAGAKVVDLSGGFRYSDVSVFEEWYKIPHKAPEAQAQAIYGLTEVNRSKIKTASLIANPGCYTTCSILALLPVLKNRLVRSSGIVIDAKSGITGAGRKGDTSYSFCELGDNFKAYSAIRHRHTSEIEDQLSIAAGEKITLLFTPHLLPVKRGILATIYTELMPGVGAEDIQKTYKAQFAGEPFVHVLPKGDLPELKHVVGSNNLFIGFDVSERTGRLIIVACLDNLIKGAAGQAIQNFNIMNGLDETLGLPRTAWYL